MTAPHPEVLDTDFVVRHPQMEEKYPALSFSLPLAGGGVGISRWHSGVAKAGCGNGSALLFQGGQSQVPRASPGRAPNCHIPSLGLIACL